MRAFPLLTQEPSALPPPVDATGIRQLRGEFLKLGLELRKVSVSTEDWRPLMVASCLEPATHAPVVLAGVECWASPRLRKGEVELHTCEEP